MSRNSRRQKTKADDFASLKSFNAAQALFSSGDLPGALRQCLQLLESCRDHPGALQMGGIAAFQLGDMTQAGDLLGRFCRINRKDPEAHYNHGVALQAAGDFQGAVKAYLSTIKFDPLRVEAFNNLGRAYESLGRIDDAMSAFRKGIEIAPGRPESQNNLGLLLHNQGKLAEAEALFRRCLQAVPGEPNVLNNLGNTLREQGRFEDAIGLFGKALESQPDNPSVLKNLGLALQGSDRNEEARDIFSRVVEIQPGDAEAHTQLADQSYRLGHTDDVKRHLRHALDINPADENAYYLLMKVKKVKDLDDEYLSRLTSLLDDPNIEDEKRLHLNLAASLAYESLGDDAQSFRYLKTGNDLKAKLYPHDPKKEISRFESIKEIFNPAFLKRFEGGGSSSQKPIFILGMPRSGTTLVEQILSSHSRVHGAGELKNLSYHVEKLTGYETPYPQGVADWGEDKIDSLAQAYMDDIEKMGENPDRVTDKLPANFLYLGLIRLALPKARIIHCTRDAMDTCFSCYKQNFSSGQLFSNDLKDLGRYYRLYEDLMNHWRALFPGDILDVSYEKTVEDPEAAIRRMLDFCALDWEDSCLNFHQNKRQVRTASAMQVRQPIYKSSLKAWQRFEQELQPLVKALKL